MIKWMVVVVDSIYKKVKVLDICDTLRDAESIRHDLLLEIEYFSPENVHVISYKE